MKKVRAVPPYYYEGRINFKHKPYDAWVKLGGMVTACHYPWRLLHSIVFKYKFPSLFRCESEARLRFVQPQSVNFDTFPDYMFYEIIPFFWDCWPESFDKVFRWLDEHRVKTAIFTSSQFANMVRNRFPKMNVLAITEGIDVENYRVGKELKDRTIDFFHYGREIDNVVKYDFTNNIKYVSAKKNAKAVFPFMQLSESLADSRVVAAYPKSWTNPEQTAGIETLTQRYWECMLSRCVMVGHAPKELIELLGYNPVIELDINNPQEQLETILSEIENFQSLVDKNRLAALKYGDWKYSVHIMIDFLSDNNYICIK